MTPPDPAERVPGEPPATPPEPPATPPEPPATPPEPLASVVVVGTGLIGTSVALALRERGISVWLADRDLAAARLAADLGAGQPLPADGVPGGPADVAVLAVPPAAVADQLKAAQSRRLARCYTDVASVKELPLAGASGARL